MYAGLFPFLLYLYGDVDGGWHLRYGEYLLTHGRILRQDIFSWTMEGYPWTNHSWLYDPLLYLIYTHFSFVGLSLAGAMAGLGAFIFGISFFQLSYWQKAVLAGVFATLTSGALVQGLRSQVVGLLLLALAMFLLFNLREGRTWSYVALPGVFAVGECPRVLRPGTRDLLHLSDRRIPAAHPRDPGREAHHPDLRAGLVSRVPRRDVREPVHGRRLPRSARSTPGGPLHHYVAEWRPEELSGPRGIVLGAYTLCLAGGFAM